MVNGGDTLLSYVPYAGLDRVLSTATVIARPWEGRKFSVFGDSISDNYNWLTDLAAMHGASVDYRDAVSGRKMAAIFSNNPTADSIANTDLLFIEHGTNDYQGGQVGQTILGSITDASGANSFYGATRYAIETLLGWKPTMRLVMITPYFSQDRPKAMLQPICDAIREVAYDYSLPVISFDQEGGLNQFNWDAYLQDGLHPVPTQAGYNKFFTPLIARKIAQWAPIF
jgi:hypothetical protein